MLMRMLFSEAMCGFKESKVSVSRGRVNPPAVLSLGPLGESGGHPSTAAIASVFSPECGLLQELCVDYPRAVLSGMTDISCKVEVILHKWAGGGSDILSSFSPLM